MKDYEIAVSILKANGWYFITVYKPYILNYWRHASSPITLQDATLQKQPKYAVEQLGLDWDANITINNAYLEIIKDQYQQIAANPVFYGKFSNSLPNYQTLPNPNNVGTEEIDGFIQFHPVDPSQVISFAPTNSCDHQWKTYTGLNETFTYCTICDVKKQ